MMKEQDCQLFSENVHVKHEESLDNPARHSQIIIIRRKTSFPYLEKSCVT